MCVMFLDNLQGLQHGNGEQLGAVVNDYNSTQWLPTTPGTFGLLTAGEAQGMSGAASVRLPCLLLQSSTR